MRFLHTADWHLGRIFYNTHLTDDQAYVLEQFVALVADARPDAVIIAGDVYDRAVPPPEAVNLLGEVLTRILLDYKVPVLVIAGNHDSPERIGFGGRVFARQQLHLVGQVGGAAPVVLEDQYGPVYFCPLPYAEPALVRERLGGTEVTTHEQALAALVADFAGRLPADGRRVAIGHAYVGGGMASESERPLSIGGSATVSSEVFAPFHYTALGHLHQAQQAGQSHIRYSGSLLKYSFAEASHRKSVSLVELDAAGKVTVEPVTLTPRRDLRCLRGRLEDILAGAEKDSRTDDYIMATLEDSGAILDPIGKLRRVYPNVMHIEKAEYAAAGETDGIHRDHRRQTESDLFSDFFAQVTGTGLAEGEKNTLTNLLEAFNRREREAGV